MQFKTLSLINLGVSRKKTHVFSCKLRWFAVYNFKILTQMISIKKSNKIVNDVAFLPFLGMDDFMRVPDFKRIFFTKYITRKTLSFFVFRWCFLMECIFRFTIFFLLFLLLYFFTFFNFFCTLYFVFCAHKTKGMPL